MKDRTLARLRALQSDLIDPTIAVHSGRIVKRTGDSSIIEFRSVVDAVLCAIEVHRRTCRRCTGHGRQAVLFHGRSLARWPEYRFPASGQQLFKRQDGYFIIRALHHAFGKTLGSLSMAFA